MKPYLILAFLFHFIYINSFSQTINGQIYDTESTAKGIKIFNKNKKIFAYTNEDGEFSINATVNDTLTFSSLFYVEKSIKLTHQHFEGIIVIELTKIVNQLNEVLLTDTGKEKPFDEHVYSANLSNQIKTDIKNNPHLYGAMPSGGIDFFKLASLMFNLFKKKNNKEQITFIN